MYRLIISIQHAQRIALKKVPGTIQCEDMELKYGVMFYKFYILTEENKRFKVEVNAKTAKVLKVKELKSPDHDD